MKQKPYFELAAKVPFMWLLCLIVTNTAFGQTAKTELPKEKQTTLGLYVTSAEAYEKWKANPEKVKILDVRTPEEYLFIGHPAMAWNISIFLQSYNWDAEKGHFAMKPNPHFMGKIKKTFQPDDIILVEKPGLDDFVAVICNL